MLSVFGDFSFMEDNHDVGMKFVRTREVMEKVWMGEHSRHIGGLLKVWVRFESVNTRSL